MPDLYFRIYGDYAGPDPIWMPREQCPWLGEVEHHWQTIRDEFLEVLARRPEAVTPSYVPDDVEIHGWRSVNLMTYGHWYRDNCRRFPRTVEILSRVPGLTSAFVNLLEPGSSLPAHNGDTNAIYRNHIGLVVPAGVDECGLEVGGERTGWAEGQGLTFIEAYRHHVWNRTKRNRVILVFDVIRPEFAARKVSICAAVLAAMALTGLETRIPFLGRLPQWARRVLHRCLAVGAWLVLVVRDGAH